MSDSSKKNLFQKPFSRRDALKLAGAGGIGLLLGAGGLKAGAFGEGVLGTAPAPSAGRGTVIPFYGDHQAGIVTPMQDFICMGAFDLRAKDLGEVRELFKRWTEAAARMSQGLNVGEENSNPLVPPDDTGEAAGLQASRTTITFGLGASFFDERYGLSGQRPPGLVDMPRFKGDALQSEWSGGDVAVQVCADDPQVAFHAIRNLIRIGRGKAVLRWLQEGFQRTGAADPQGATPRNLMGFKDGTNNPAVHDAAAADEIVWARGGDTPAWMAGGSYLVMRRIRMRIEVWDRTTLGEQEATFGRHRDTGAPLGGKDEFEKLDLAKKDEAGKPLLPADSHVALANMEGKVKIHRRGFSYSNGIDLKTGQLDAGLLFLCYNRDPREQFIPMQQKLAAADKLNEYIVHVGSGLYAALPGVKQGGYIGDTLF
ncbi:MULTISPECIES: iron uptake transporter deferrochelatase/peroxidase subunit [Paenibacillus]|uniref:iron uptake transporter deferrochelatase/peroxidase subunit n=1 Tax=Paenibacillus TaxID=44249 RepID=UPI0022B928BC|nr:iron uptake transporter deferrochelatase/peroxidase subunit [Paenibacillus caseinilyticus]MCZ8522224.1 iron uptake transporter deferrochelatase/peroxidase subunit [Paenibacillus caseinilyticus]